MIVNLGRDVLCCIHGRQVRRHCKECQKDVVIVLASVRGRIEMLCILQRLPGVGSEAGAE